MTKEALKYIYDTLTNSGINYEFGDWTGKVVYPYSTGEYQEVPLGTEDGHRQAAFILNFFARGSNAYLQLEETKEIVETLFMHLTTMLSNGSGLSIEYDNAFIVPTDNAELKRMQINLTINEWRLI